MNNTVIPSAPASDAISQTQIALNNMMDQVRESYLYLLEGAPAIGVNGRIVDQPKEMLNKWRVFRSEFEASWRLGEKLNMPPPPPVSNADANDIETRALNDSLFRAQRIVTIAQCIRQQIPDLPKSAPSITDLESWEVKNERLNQLLNLHASAIKDLSNAITYAIRQTSQNIIDQK